MMYGHRKCKIPGRYVRTCMHNTRYTHACGVCLWVVFLGHGCGALGIFKSPVCTYNQAWACSLSASHYFSFLLSKRSGRRMPPAERSALYNITNGVLPIPYTYKYVRSFGLRVPNRHTGTYYTYVYGVAHNGVSRLTCPLPARQR